METEKRFVFRLNDSGDGPDVVRQVFLERGWIEFDAKTQQPNDWNMWWRTSRFRNCDFEHIMSWQRLNHYPKTNGLTRKDSLARNLKRMRAVHGPSVYNFSPLAFNLPNDYTRFVAEYTKRKQHVVEKENLWICKPADLSRGRGIFLFRDISELQYNCNAVAQKYISNPLLIAGYKFDLRIYVVVSCFHPLTFYISQEGLVRFSTEKFDLTTLNNVYSHLTNTSINIHSPAYTADKERVGPGCKWTITQLRYYFRQNEIDDRMMWAKVVNIVILTLIMQTSQVPKVNNCFEMYGFDILIDETLKPWLLEVNFSPALSLDCPADGVVKKSLIHDLMDMMKFKKTDADRGSVQAKNLLNSGQKENVHASSRKTSVSRLSQLNSSRLPSIHCSLNLDMDLIRDYTTISSDEDDERQPSTSKLCYGLPLVQPGDETKSSTSSGRSSADSQFFERTPSTINQTIKRNDSFNSVSCISDKSRLSSTSRRVYSVTSKHSSNSDSAISSMSGGSTNSDRILILDDYKDTRRKTSMKANPETKITLDKLSVPTQGIPMQIKSLRPSQNSRSMQKMYESVNNVPIYKKDSLHTLRSSPKHTNLVSSQPRLIRRRHSDKGSAVRPDAEVRRRRLNVTLTRSMSGSITGTSIPKKKKEPHHNRTITQPARSNVKSSPSVIGNLYLIFPFNDAVKKACVPALDTRVIIRETQKILKDALVRVETNSGVVLKMGGIDRRMLWGPIKQDGS